MLSEDIEGRTLLQNFITRLNKWMDVYGLECVAYSPKDIDEALYELWATEWVVQHGDLNVTSMKLGKAYWTLQGGNEDALTTLEEAMRTYRDLNADADICAAYRRAVALEEGGVNDQCNKAVAANSETTESNNRRLPQLPCVAFYRAFNSSPPLLRALLRARLFAGTISAGSGSSQVTLRSSASLERSQVHSVPLGNRTPLIGMKLNQHHEGVTMLSKKLPQTRKLALELLCDVEIGTETAADGHSAYRPSDRSSTYKETRPAWTEDGPVDMKRLELWRELVVCCARERELPQEQRGLFVGISAVFYAAQLAGCAGEILGRDQYLNCLTVRRDELLARGGSDGDGRDLANLTLVIALVEFVLHRTAIIVCKRNWRVGEGGRGDNVDFVATWTLGLYLKHSGVMGVPLLARS